MLRLTEFGSSRPAWATDLVSDKQTSGSPTSVPAWAVDWALRVARAEKGGVTTGDGESRNGAVWKQSED